MPIPIQAHFVAAGRFHDIDFARLELLKLLAEHPHVRTSVAMDFGDIGRLADCAFLVTYTCDLIPSVEETEALRAFLQRGGRWLALHGTNSILRVAEDGLVTTPDIAPEFMALLGTQFQSHPPIGAFKVEVVDPNHPLTRGLGSFKIIDELYLTGPRAEIEPLLVTHFEGKTPGFDPARWPQTLVPIQYLRRVGNGAVLYNTLGHCRGHYDFVPVSGYWPHPDRCAWNYPIYYELLRRGLLWAIGQL